MAVLNSKKFFLKYFFDDYLSLANDPTHSVQVKFLMAAPVIGAYINYEQILNIITKIEYSQITLKQLCDQAVNHFKSKGFLEKFNENLTKDKAKELFEHQQELQEVKELEFPNKRKVVDEMSLKNNTDKQQKPKKLPIKGRIHSESIEPKARGTKSTAMIKPLIPAKKK